ncbi:MAG: response regulator [Pseudobdellovibrionaceae bacterium]
MVNQEKIDLSFFKILVAEDNLINQKLLNKRLERMNVRFKLVSSGEEVIMALRMEYFDLVLLDCYLKEMSGFDTAILIRNSKEQYADIPLIAFSAGLYEKDIETSRQAGMNDFIIKPVTYEQLREKIINWTWRIFEELPVLDISSLEKIRSIDDHHQTLVRSLFQIYSENTQAELYKMRDLIQEGQDELLRKKAHMLKSSAVQLGATRFGKFCHLMEHEEDLSRARAKKLYAEMCSEYENSRKKFFEYCQNLSQNFSALI